MLTRASFGDARRVRLALGFGLVALVGLTVAVGASPTALEMAVAGAAPTDGIIAPASRIISTAGSVVVCWAIVLLGAASLARARPWAAVELVTLVAAAEAANVAVKALVSRARPAAAGAGDLIVGAGYPSGHVTRVAVAFGACLVLLPIARRHPRASILVAVMAVATMALARVGAGDHYVADVLGGMLLATIILASWALIRTGWLPARWFVPAGMAILMALSILIAAPRPSLAASPEPSSRTGGDPRSSGQGPGFVGDAPIAIGLTLAVGLGAALSTYAYVRLTAKRKNG